MTSSGSGPLSGGISHSGLSAEDRPPMEAAIGAAAANTPSGYDLLVFRNGIKMKYAAVPSSYQEYFYDSGNNEIDVLASGDADEYEVVYRS